MINSNNLTADGERLGLIVGLPLGLIEGEVVGIREGPLVGKVLGDYRSQDNKVEKRKIIDIGHANKIFILLHSN